MSSPSRHALRATPRTSRRRDLITRFGTRAVLGVALVLAAGGLLVGMTRAGADRDTAVRTVTVVAQQRDQAAQDAADVAAPVAAVCRAGGSAATALDAAGLCGRARQALQSPAVAARPTTLTPAMIDDIVAKVAAAQPPAPSLDSIVEAVLAQMRDDPRLRGVTEAEVRTIVAAAIAQRPTEHDGADPTLRGVSYERRNGQCTVVVTTADHDGTAHTQTSSARDAACSTNSAPDVASPGPTPTSAAPAPAAQRPPAAPAEPAPTATPRRDDPSPQPNAQPAKHEDPPSGDDQPDSGDSSEASGADKGSVDEKGSDPRSDDSGTLPDVSTVGGDAVDLVHNLT